MPLTVNEQKASFSLSGPDVEPQHWAWALAGPQERRAYFLALGQACYRRKIRELASGIGVDGRPLKPVLPTSRPDGATGPPLSPHDAASRSQRYLSKTPHADPDRCTLYWIKGWAKVIHGHMVGWGHLPVRNVVGLTQRHFREAVAEARAGWAQTHGAAPPKPAPQTAADLAAKYPHLAPFLATPVAKPVPKAKPKAAPKPKPLTPPKTKPIAAAPPPPADDWDLTELAPLPTAVPPPPPKPVAPKPAPKPAPPPPLPPTPKPKPPAPATPAAAVVAPPVPLTPSAGPRAFTDVGRPPSRAELGQAEHFAEATWKRWVAGLSPEQRSALKDYKGFGYTIINRELRTTGPVTITKAVKAIDEALNEAHTPEDLVVWRGVTNRGAMKLNAPRVGATFKDPGYVSVSLNKKVSQDIFYNRDRGAMFRITIPKGTPAGHLDVLSGENNPGKSGGEYELLLHRGTEFRITGVRRYDDGGLLIDAEYVGSAHAKPKTR